MNRLRMLDSLAGALAFVALMTGTSVVASAQDDAPTAELKHVIENAKKEGKLQLVWGNHILGGVAGARELEKRINAKYGTNISIQFTTGPSGPTIRSQLRQELAAKQPAITDVMPLADASVEEVWAPIDWRALVPSVPEDAIYMGGKTVTIATPIVGITYNSKLIPADKAPKSLSDLLKPEWKGKIATMPYIYGAQFFALPDMLGEEKLSLIHI